MPTPMLNPPDAVFPLAPSSDGSPTSTPVAHRPFSVFSLSCSTPTEWVLRSRLCRERRPKSSPACRSPICLVHLLPAASIPRKPGACHRCLSADLASGPHRAFRKILLLPCPGLSAVDRRRDFVESARARRELLVHK